MIFLVGMMAIRCAVVFRFDDNPLCYGDTMSSLEYLIRARALTGFADMVRSAGGDPEKMLQAAGLDPVLLDNPEASLSLERMGGLLKQAGLELELPDFGLRLAQYQDISVVGAIAMIALHSTTFGAAMHSLARHWSYHTPGGFLTVFIDSQHMEVRYELVIRDEEARRHAMELSFAVLLRFLRIYTPQAITQTRITFRHEQALDGRLYRKHFHCPASFAQERNAVVLPLGLATEPLADNANEELRVVAERYIQSVVRRFPLDLGNQVRTLIERQLANGMVSINKIAAQLNFHPRTLQRRLAAQGLSFDRLLDDLRRERAQELLGQQAIPLSQVGDLLGYGQQSTFIQACHRWFGMPPGLVRQSQPS